jgi:hypothetical protein
MRTREELREWLCGEIVDVMDSYDCNEDSARQHIRDMLVEGQDSYSDVTDDEVPVVLRLIESGRKSGKKGKTTKPKNRHSWNRNS